MLAMTGRLSTPSRIADPIIVSPGLPLSNLRVHPMSKNAKIRDVALLLSTSKERRLCLLFDGRSFAP